LCRRTRIFKGALRLIPQTTTARILLQLKPLSASHSLHERITPKTLTAAPFQDTLAAVFRTVRHAARSEARAGEDLRRTPPRAQKIRLSGVTNPRCVGQNGEELRVMHGAVK
jgi:hypothetical protein